MNVLVSVMLVEGILEKFDIFRLRNSNKVNIPRESCVLVDVKTALDHYLGPPPAGTRARQSLKFPGLSTDTVRAHKIGLIP